MNETMAITVGDTGFTRDTVMILRGATGNAAEGLLPRHMPASIPADQVYYWSASWQRDIRETMAALAAGDYVDFNDPEDSNDIVRWFLSDDEE